MRTPWYRDHPALSAVLVFLAGILGALGGIGIASACVFQHLISPDNPLAGGAIGFGGALAGGAGGALAVARPRRTAVSSAPEGQECIVPGIRPLPEPGDYEVVASEMGIDPAAPMTPEQHAEFGRRMDERTARRARDRLAAREASLRAAGVHEDVIRMMRP